MEKSTPDKAHGGETPKSRPDTPLPQLQEPAVALLGNLSVQSAFASPADVDNYQVSTGSRILGATRDGRTTLARQAEGDGNFAAIRAHEAIHRAQARAFRGGAPAASRTALEADARMGTRSLLAGREFHTAIGAGPGACLFWDPPGGGTGRGGGGSAAEAPGAAPMMEFPTRLAVPIPSLERSSIGPLADSEYRYVDYPLPAEQIGTLAYYLVSIDDVYASREEADAAAQAGAAALAPHDSPTPFQVGQTVFTTESSFEVVALEPNFVVTTQYVSFAVGSGNTSLYRTSAGVVLVDAGVQMRVGNPGPGMPVAAIADAVVRELGTLVPEGRIHEIVITHSHADHINLIPRLAESFEIGTIRITARQASRGLFERVMREAAQSHQRYRQARELQIRNELEATRSEWEGRQDLRDVVNTWELEENWTRHRDAEVSRRMAQIRAPRLELLVAGPNGLYPINVPLLSPSVPTGTEFGETASRDLLVEGERTTFVHPEEGPATRRGEVLRGAGIDTASAGYVVELRNGVQLAVVADQRAPDFAAIRQNFEAALSRMQVSDIRIFNMSHHMMIGWADDASRSERAATAEEGATPSRAITTSDFAQMTRMLTEFANTVNAEGQPTANTVMVSARQASINPAHVWLLRNLGFEVFIATEGNQIEVLDVLLERGERVSGVRGEGFAARAPEQAVLRRAELALIRMQQSLEALDAGSGREGTVTHSPDELARITELETNMAELRRLKAEYETAFYNELSRGPSSPRPPVAPDPTDTGAPEPALAQRDALLAELERLGFEETGTSASPRFSEPVLAILGRGSLEGVDPQTRQIIEHYQEISAIRAGLEPGSMGPGTVARLLGHMEGLQLLLEQSLEGAASERNRAILEQEVARISGELETLRNAVDTRVVVDHDPVTGVRRSTRITAERETVHDPRSEWSRARHGVDAVGRGVGRGFGAVMIYHSITGQINLERSQTDDLNSQLQGLLQTTHNAAGLAIGLRMVRAVHVHPGEFVLLAVINVAEAAAGNYERGVDQESAIKFALLRNSIQLTLFGVGGAMMRSNNPWIAGAGLGVMMLVDPLLELFGAYDAMERALAFEPSEVTYVGQELRDLLADYRVIVGSIELAQRDSSDLVAMGAGDPDRLRSSASSAVDSRRQEAREKEPDILDAFADAYESARTAHTGLRLLDSMRNNFFELRERAFSDTVDPGRDRIRERFSEIEDSLDLSFAGEDEIRDMDQWSEIDERLNGVAHLGIFHAAGLHDAMFEHGSDDVDWEEVMDEFRLVETMLQNARYRLDPSAQGPDRRLGLFADQSRARQVYEEELQERERRFSRYIGRMRHLGRGDTLPVQPFVHPRDRIAFAPIWEMHEEQLEPGAETGVGYTEVGEHRVAYRYRYDAADNVHEALDSLRESVRHFRLALDGATESLGVMPWVGGVESSFEFRRQYQEYFADSGKQAARTNLQSSEMALQSALHMARSMVLRDDTVGTATSMLEYQDLQRDAQALMAARMHEHRYYYADEMDQITARIRGHEELRWAQALGANADDPTLTPTEREALGGDELDEFGRELATSYNQLQTLRELQSGHAPGVTRGLQLFSLQGSGTIGVRGDIGPMGGHDFSALTFDDNVIVGLTGHSDEFTSMRGHISIYEMMPISAEAVELFGTNRAQMVDGMYVPVQVNPDTLEIEQPSAVPPVPR